MHDYGGYAFPLQLSRTLARRGHEVLHLFCQSVASPRGLVNPRSDDPDTFTVEAISLGRNFEKYRPAMRLLQEYEYGRFASQRTMAFRPDVVMSANTPLLSQRELLKRSQRSGALFVYWLQDILGLGLRNVLVRRHPMFGEIASLPFRRSEEAMLRRSNAVVAISTDFVDYLETRRVRPGHVDVIENWAPVAELPPRPRINSWRKKLGLGDSPLVLYAGTLGYKHNPELLVQLAQKLSSSTGAQVVVASEGRGADVLARRKRELRLENLLLVGFQPYEELADMLGAADVLVVILEPDAGVFSVPSKLLTKLCSGRPIVAAVPAENLAARVIAASGGAVRVEPTDARSLASEVTRLLNDSSERAALGQAGRAFSEMSFDIERITDHFERIFEEATARASKRRQAWPRRSSYPFANVDDPIA